MSDKLKEKYSPIVAATSVFKLHDITQINHKPHTFMVGPRHVAHASDHCGGKLGEETMKAVTCAHPGCGMPYEAHTSDRVMALKLVTNASNEEAQQALKDIVAATEHEYHIDGFVFIKSEFNFTE
jgi:hypothetical protein